MKTDNKPQEKDWDHKVLGRKLDLFTFSDTVGKGLPLWTPKGAVIRRELERFIVDEELKRGYLHVYTPDIAKLELYEKSGHYPYYKDDMYAPIQIDDEKFMLRPMSCPHHFELFLSRPRSYRELPLRFAELAKLYRYEQSGELMGLQRVRGFCLSDAHIIVSHDQVQSEIGGVLDLIKYVSQQLGLIEGSDYRFRLSLGDRNNDKKYFKDDKAWDDAEDILRQALKANNLEYFEGKNDAAFYGPKIDIQMKNANGKEETAITVQYDFVMPKRFDLTFVNEKGEKEEAVVIHRSSIGAIERTIAFLIEKYKGNFPTWLTPIQVRVLPISEKNLDYAKQILQKLLDSNIRAEVDDRDEKIQEKIRKGHEDKVSYMLIVGDKEEKDNTVTERARSGKADGPFAIETFIKNIKEEIDKRTIN